MKEQSTIEVATSAVAASKATMYTGGGASIVGAVASIDWLAIAGFLIAIAGFCVNAYFQYRRHKREELEALVRMKREQDIHEFEMAKLKGECNVKQD